MNWKYLISLAALLLNLQTSRADGESPSPLVDFLLEYLAIKYSDENFHDFIYVAAKSQKLYLISNGEILETYRVSTAKRGIGSEEGSLKTPQGLHVIAEKVGEGLPPLTLIKQKVATGEVVAPVREPESTYDDFITSRILHLRGREPGVNAGPGIDSYERGIFIHGTHEEGLIGTPASKGCIRMTNHDVIDLFRKVEVGTFVVILNN